MIETIQFSSLGEFFDMGGYAFNVWSVYALFFLFFFINVYFPLLKRKQLESQMEVSLETPQSFHVVPFAGVSSGQDLLA